MSRVQRLPSDLVNQIAAGEVVERPASVVKELVENALDAGATVIDVLLEAGGKKLIEVRDNGSGMNEEDAILALERHATSKIRDFDDLTRVRTLGFRGEALPSIASVSRFTLTTSDGSGDHATEIDCDPLTARVTVRPAARDRGTTISVRELFENVPARRKFLRSVDAEFRSIVTILSSYALPFPSRAFRLEHNGRVVLDLAPAADSRERVLQVIGDDAAAHLEAVDITIGDTSATGFVTRGLRFGSRRNQFFFVNGRLVKDRVLTHAANRAADAFDFDGHPAIVLYLDVPPELVDVNVHPAKTEVRFRDSSQAHVAVEQGIKRALGGAEEGSALLQAPASLPVFEMPAFTPRIEFTPLFQQRAVVQPPAPAGGADISAAAARSSTSSFGTASLATPAAELPESETANLGDLHGRVVGQYRLSYILIDMPGGLRLIDQHVAHERVLFDRYLKRIEQHSPVSQQLLTPILYDTGAAEGALLDSHAEELRAVGFDIERFSGNSFAISSVPPELVRGDVDAFLRKLIDAALDEKRSHLLHVRDKVVASLACQAAIKVHRPLSGEEMARLTAELLDSSNPFACPHGRPIIVDIRHLDIERHFHRK
jgi:DNA mismatch repair protein MutL